MDLLSVMNQRHTETNSELRHTRWLFAGHATAALAALVCAMAASPARRATRSSSTAVTFFGACLFAILSIVSYALSVRGLRLLNTNRFLPPPLYTNPRVFSSLLAPPPRDQLSGPQRIVFSYGFTAVSLVALICGFTSLPFTVYVLTECVAVVLYATYAGKLLRLMSPGSSLP